MQQTYADQRQAVLAALDIEHASPSGQPGREGASAPGGDGPAIEVTVYLGGGDQQRFTADCDNVDGYIQNTQEILAILSWIEDEVERKRNISPPFNKLSDHEADTYRAYQSQQSALEQLRQFQRTCP
jgi:hypothetical protein